MKNWQSLGAAASVHIIWSIFWNIRISNWQVLRFDIPERAEEFVRKAGKGRAFTDYREMSMMRSIRIWSLSAFALPATGKSNSKPSAGNPVLCRETAGFGSGSCPQDPGCRGAKGLITASGFQCRYSNIVQPTIDFLKTHEVPYVECARMGGVPGTPGGPKSPVPAARQSNRLSISSISSAMSSASRIPFLDGDQGFVKGIEDMTPMTFQHCDPFKNGALGTISTGCYATDGACFDSKITFSAPDPALTTTSSAKSTSTAKNPGRRRFRPGRQRRWNSRGRRHRSCNNPG